MSGLAGFALAKGLIGGLSRCPNPAETTRGEYNCMALLDAERSDHATYRRNAETPKRWVFLVGDSLRQGEASSRSYVVRG